MTSIKEKLEKTVHRVERMHEFRNVFYKRSHHGLLGREDGTKDIARYCDAVIHNLETQVASLKKKLSR